MKRNAKCKSWNALLGAAKPAPEHLATKEMFDPTTFVPREKATKKFIQIQCFNRTFVNGSVSFSSWCYSSGGWAKGEPCGGPKSVDRMCVLLRFGM